MSSTEVRKTVKQRIIEISNSMKMSNDGKVEFGKTKYNYITPDSIKNSLKPLLLEHKLFLHFTQTKNEVGNNVGILTVSDFDTNDGAEIYTMEINGDISIGGNAVQGHGGLRTYMFRYLCLDAFMIADNSTDIEGKDVKDVAKEQRSNNTTDWRNWKNGDPIPINKKTGKEYTLEQWTWILQNKFGVNNGGVSPISTIDEVFNSMAEVLSGEVV